ncbi:MULTISPECIES: DMT family transporter [unclassified Rhizobium]|uniref:DMT family transporter n=1 Tax=unclassified Rhizobium TaxID=2613769 RepID=UPI0016085717|nr:MULTISPECIES: DMT family transporter [unclassified Rhizobium]MBB3545198.1 drug/metabolite transporter (DMT)-like permease [Rhizobium sp. BK399]
MKPRHLASLFVLVSAAMFSTAGLFMGLLKAPLLAVVFWRSAFALIFTVLLLVHQRDLRALIGFDSHALLASTMSALATLFFIAALRLTSVANVAVIHASLPLLTTMIAVVVSNETASSRTTAFGVLAAAGAIFIFSGSVSSGLRILGDALALAMTSCMAVMTIAFRMSKTPTVLGMVALSNAISMVVAASIGDHLAVTGREACLLAAFALFQMTLGLVFYAKGARQLPPAETALLSLAEMPLSIISVWLAYGMRPSWQTACGGSLVLCAVVAHLATPRSAIR